VPLAHRTIRQALIPDLAEEQYAFGLGGIEQPLEHHEDLARLHVDFRKRLAATLLRLACRFAELPRHEVFDAAMEMATIEASKAQFSAPTS
jgi:hypothetical protein